MSVSPSVETLGPTLNGRYLCYPWMNFVFFGTWKEHIVYWRCAFMGYFKPKISKMDFLRFFEIFWISDLASLLKWGLYGRTLGHPSIVPVYFNFQLLLK